MTPVPGGSPLAVVPEAGSCPGGWRASGLERGGADGRLFPIRLRAAADLAAARSELLAGPLGTETVLGAAGESGVRQGGGIPAYRRSEPRPGNGFPGFGDRLTSRSENRTCTGRSGAARAARLIYGALSGGVGLPAAAALAAYLTYGGSPAPAAAMQILDAADHVELEASISATEVSRIARANDRIRRVIRSPGGFDLEHVAASGDLYLHPVGDPDMPFAADGIDALPITLFLGTEKSFTCRLALTPEERESAQVLIRNPAVDGEPAAGNQVPKGGDARVAALVQLVRATARREVLLRFVP